MSGYLDEYGVAERRREGIVKKIALVALIAAVIGAALYFQFRNFSEERQIKSFLNLLQEKNYSAAYQLWGCTEENPCTGYSFEKFLEDWGQESQHPDPAAARITRTRTCSDGIIQTLRFGEEDEIWLWVGSSDLVIGFAPWPVCNPRIPESSLGGQ